MITLLLKCSRNHRIFSPTKKVSARRPLCTRGDRAGQKKLARAPLAVADVEQTLGGKVQKRKSPSMSWTPNQSRFEAAWGLAWLPVFFEKTQGEPNQEQFA